MVADNNSTGPFQFPGNNKPGTQKTEY